MSVQTSGRRRCVFDGAVKKCYGGKRKVEWMEVLAGEKAHQKKGDYAPEETIETIRRIQGGKSKDPGQPLWAEGSAVSM